jgi:hypothetical protein
VQQSYTGSAAPAKSQGGKAGSSSDKPQTVQTGIIPMPNVNVSAFDVVGALTGKIPGVTLAALGPRSLLYTLDPAKVNVSPENTKTKGPSQIESQLRALIGGLPSVTVKLKVIPLPEGYGHACDIVTAIGHHYPEVLSLYPIDDSRILAGISGNDPAVGATTRTLTKLVEQLAVTSVAPAPHVASVTTQLFYDRDAAGVANAITQAFPQLKVSPISMNAGSAYADSLILADPTGSPQNSHSALEQARRMIAQLDEPRPQITVNAWSLQASAQNQTLMRPLVPEARRFAAGYNDALEKAVEGGWSYLISKATGDDFLDPVFAAYLCGRADWNGNGGFSIFHRGVCPNEPILGYSLGYGDLFDRESPNLVQMMLVVMATRNPQGEVDATLDHMEGVDGAVCGNPLSDHRVEVTFTSDHGGSCTKLIDLSESCQSADERFYEQFDKAYPSDLKEENADGEWERNRNFKKLRELQPPSHVAFSCTRQRLADLLTPATQGTKPTTSFLGQFRAAVADFLFQNKMRAEYRDDFQPYLFPQSAARLDSVLTPIIEAFNQDMQALQQHLQKQLTQGIERDKNLAYSSNGLITVNVISGNQASVQTQSLNYFPQNPTMKLEQFAQALAAAASGGSGGSGSGGGGSGSSGGGSGGSASSASQSAGASAAAAATHLLGGSLSAIVPAVAAFGAAEPAQVTAKVGSGLSLVVTPYALSSDSGAELNVNVSYTENAAAMISSNAAQAQASDDLNSRVSNHQVQTLVRMDALKFFEVSTLQSVIARQKAPYKILDPIIELPILDGLGVFPNIRRKPDVIYNQSVIFLQASILPTAADLGNSVRLQYDRIKPCGDELHWREAVSEADFDCPVKGEDASTNQLARVMDYHRQLVRYFSSQFPVNGGVSSRQSPDSKCVKDDEESSREERECFPTWQSIPQFAGAAAFAGELPIYNHSAEGNKHP